MIEGQVQRLLVPAVTLLIAFLAYASQLLFPHLEPGPLTTRQTWIFNLLVGGIWISYCRAIVVDPGRIPTAGQGKSADDGDVRQRYCRKCDALKPPRSHHCKVCQRCIPKMDHHCPWTANCVSFFTFPHFMRFLCYAMSSMVYLEYFLSIRAGVIWGNRKLPSYLGPSAQQLIFLFILIAVNSITIFAVGIIFLRTTYDLACNTTTIEGWEIERHEQLLRRARALGGYLDGPNGTRMRLTRHEFPYDIGIWSNICQGMGTRNVLAWFWPFSATPTKDGITFETNGFEDLGTSWPPPDPDRMPRIQRKLEPVEAFTYQSDYMTPSQELEAFKLRQQQDLDRRAREGFIIRRKPFHARFDSETHQPLSDADLGAGGEEGSSSGEEGWQDSEGNRLQDYGVDETVEFYDEEDNMTLAELIKKRQRISAK